MRDLIGQRASGTIRIRPTTAVPMRIDCRCVRAPHRADTLAPVPIPARPVDNAYLVGLVRHGLMQAKVASAHDWSGKYRKRFWDRFGHEVAVPEVRNDVLDTCDRV